MSKECHHNQLIARLQVDKKYGQQKGYCTQQCRKFVTVNVPAPKLNNADTH